MFKIRRVIKAHVRDELTEEKSLEYALILDRISIERVKKYMK